MTVPGLPSIAPGLRVLWLPLTLGLSCSWGQRTGLSQRDLLPACVSPAFMSQNLGSSPTLSWTPVSQGPHLAGAAGLTGNLEPSPQVRSAADETRKAWRPLPPALRRQGLWHWTGAEGVLGKDTALLSLSLVWGYLPLVATLTPGGPRQSLLESGDLSSFCLGQVCL